MIGFCGYSFCEDGNAIDPYPTSIETITNIQLENAIFDDFYITRDVTTPYSATVPTDWDFYTVLWANFNGNLSAGNIEALLSQITSIRIKRRIVGEFDRTIIDEIPVNDVSDLSFIIEDYLTANDVLYEYSWVPTLNGVEGVPLTANILSQFNGIFVCDTNTIYKFLSASYGDSTQVQKIATFEPYGRQYPVYISNALTNYQKGSISGKILGNFETTGVFDRVEMVQEKNAFLQFITNKQAKIIKDYNGNIWLVMIVDTPTVSYIPSWGNNMMSVNFNWSEIGNANSTQDLIDNGLVVGGQT